MEIFFRELGGLIWNILSSYSYPYFFPNLDVLFLLQNKKEDILEATLEPFDIHCKTQRQFSK